MRLRSPRVVAGLLLASATGCGGGGGGGGGHASVVNVSGAIVTDPSAAGLDLRRRHERAVVAIAERQRHGTLGGAQSLERRVAARSCRLASRACALRVAGTAGANVVVHALVDDGRDVVLQRDDLLADERSRSPLVGGAEPVVVARDDHELFLFEPTAAGVRVTVTPVDSPFVARRFALPSDARVAGATLLVDALLVLTRGGGSEQLLVVEPDDGATLTSVDLGRDDLEQIAGAIDVRTGRPRLFAIASPAPPGAAGTRSPTRGAARGAGSHSSGGASGSSPNSNSIVELPVETVGADHRIGAPARTFFRSTSPGVTGSVSALGYDGRFVHVVDVGGVLHVVDPDDGHEVASRPLVGAGERVVALAAELDLGLDGYRVDLEPGEALPIEWLATSDRTDRSDRRDDVAAELFVAAFDHSELLASADARPLWFLSSNDTTQSRELVAPPDRPRRFDLVVGARAGHGSYELLVGARRTDSDPSAPPTATTTHPTLGGASVELAHEVDALLRTRIDAATLASLYRDATIPDALPGRLVVRRRDAATASVVSTSLARAPGTWRTEALRTFHGVASQRSRARESSRETLAELVALADDRSLLFAEPLYRTRAAAGKTPNDPRYPFQAWQYDTLNLPNAWSSTTGAGAVVAVVDSGVRTDNGDLAANVGPDGFDFVADPTSAGDGDGLDANPFDDGTFASNSHHGSHVAGTIGARGDNGVGVSGVCWNGSLMPVRALGTDGNGNTHDAAQAILYAARLANDSGKLPSRPAAVVNCSFASQQSSTELHTAIQDAVAQGCVVVCAAGNTGHGTPVEFPAAFPESIAVGSIFRDATDTLFLAAYSATGPEIDFVAPGGASFTSDFDGDGRPDNQVLSTVGAGSGFDLNGMGLGNDPLLPDDNYLFGTSMASPHVAGICGLVKTLKPSLTPADTLTLLSRTAVDLAPSGFDTDTGWGVPDAAAALTTPVLAVSASDVDFGSTGTRLLVQARNVGVPALTVNQPFTLTPTAGPSASWLTATLLPDGETIALTADRTGLAAGGYDVTVSFTTNGGAGQFGVDLTVGSSTPTDVGTVTVLVFASDHQTLVSSTTTTAAKGYAWSLPQLPRGRYFVDAGVDVDGDGVFGEAGEPFGSYPTVANPQLLELGGLASVQLDLVAQ